MTRLRAALIFLAVWACVYLPGLGSTELKGEEGRRILPAVTMLDTGNWLVPYVGGKPFLRKPPLVNWAIAGSFALTGVRNEWTARLPSALCVLALGLTLVALGSGRGWMNAETALLAAIMAATSFGILAKARFAGAEIEGIYVPLAGMGLAMWMAWWTQRRSRWLTWTVPWLFLGLAGLAKGPLHLVFFYAIVIAVLWKAHPCALKELVCPAHLAGLTLMIGVFAAWAVPYFHTEAAHAAAKVWRDQLANRVAENVFDWKSYLLNIPRGLADQLPWLLFAPVVFAAQRSRDGGPGGPGDTPIAAGMAAANQPGRIVANIGPCRLAALDQGTFLATAICFAGFLLIPGVLPRYVLPLTLPWAVLTALALQKHAARRWVFIGTTMLAMGSLLYASEVVFFLKRYESIRPVAAQIDAAIPPGKTLILFDPNYRAEIFYLRMPYEYAPDFDDIPAEAEFVLARVESRRRLAKKRPDLIVTQVFTAKHNEELLLLQPAAGVRDDAHPVSPKDDAHR